MSKKIVLWLGVSLLLSACATAAPGPPADQPPPPPTAPPDAPADEAADEPPADPDESDTAADEPAADEETTSDDSAQPAGDAAPEPLDDLTQSWAYGLTSLRTGEPLIEEGGEHLLDPAIVSYGYNQVVDHAGNVIAPGGQPLAGGEQLILTDAYQDDHNTRAYAQVFTYMAPIRDTILYHFEETSKAEWLALTEVLTINNIKTDDAATVDARAILSTEQVYDYIAGGPTDGSAVMRYLEEAELELKCLAFEDFDFTNPEGDNHCVDHNLAEGSGIVEP